MPIDTAITFTPIQIATLTVSDTRTFETDVSGDILSARIEDAGHTLIDRKIIKDDVPLIRNQLANWIYDDTVDAIISTGGTGVTGRDVTPEAFREVMDKEIEGFGELFRWISFQSIGTSTIQSRALGGVASGTYMFALPGSRGAVKDGWDKILKDQLDNRHKPCNFVELMPRLTER